jgi:hypothetical protein
MAPLFYQDPIRLSCSADVLDHPSAKTTTTTTTMEEKSVRIVDLLSESGSSVHGVDARQPLNSFRSDLEIIRQIPRLMIDISNRSPTKRGDANKTTTSISTTSRNKHSIDDHHREDTDEGEEKVGHKRNTRISFEAHPFGQNKRHTRISVEVHPFLLFDDDSEEQVLHGRDDDDDSDIDNKRVIT